MTTRTQSGHHASPAWVCGILVGGRARRFGGHPKGLLAAPGGQPIIVQLASAFRRAQPDGEVVLLGRNTAYTKLGLPMLDDTSPDLGPIGGLLSLLRYCSTHRADALLLACDLPHLTSRTLADLMRQFAAPATCVQQDGVWQPMVSLYRPLACLPVLQRRVEQRQLGLTAALKALRAHAVQLDTNRTHEIHDWDCPSDVR